MSQVIAGNAMPSRSRKSDLLKLKFLSKGDVIMERRETLLNMSLQRDKTLKNAQLL